MSILPSSCLLEKCINMVWFLRRRRPTYVPRGRPSIAYAKPWGTNREMSPLEVERVKAYPNANALEDSRPLGAIIMIAGSEHLPCLGPGGEIWACRVL